MRKLTYEEKPRIRLYKVGIGYVAEYTGPRSKHRWRGLGFTSTAACESLKHLLEDADLGRRLEYNKRVYKRMLDGPDIGLGPSDYAYIEEEPYRPWWKRLFHLK